MRNKTFFIFVSVFAVIGVVVFFVAFGVTGNLVSSADDFFAALESGEYEDAYECLSAEFHGNTSVAELRDFAQESALAEYSGAVWWERSVSGDEGLLDGEVETKDGHYIPVTLTFYKEDDTWKIYQIDWSEYESDEEARDADIVETDG